MSGVPKYSDLREMKESELIELYDREAEHVQLDLNFVRTEIALKAQERQAQTIVRLTWLITVLTLVVTLATVVSVWRR